MDSLDILLRDCRWGFGVWHFYDQPFMFTASLGMLFTVTSYSLRGDISHTVTAKLPPSPSRQGNNRRSNGTVTPTAVRRYVYGSYGCHFIVVMGLRVKYGVKREGCLCTSACPPSLDTSYA